MKVKICGITNLEDALAACEAGADALGFNFAEEAKRKNRYIDPEAAQIIVEQLPPFVTTVAVTVNATLEQLSDYLCITQLVQLHGEEPPDLCNALGRLAIKAFRAGPDFSVDAMRPYETGAYLLDAYVPGERGGTGAVADWDRAREAAGLGIPLVLAGGLTPENVADAVRAVKPYGVDTAGGVESEPGKKDHERIRSFVRNARQISVS